MCQINVIFISIQNFAHWGDKNKCFKKKARTLKIIGIPKPNVSHSNVPFYIQNPPTQNVTDALLAGFFLFQCITEMIKKQ